jgi:hypothetical protein
VKIKGTGKSSKEAQPMLESIFSFIRDAVVIGYMFVLRIGVPILVTLFVGWWLERKLVEWDARDVAELERQKQEEKERATAELRFKM